MRTRRDRSGFTLTELLVAAVVGSLVLGATYQVFMVNQRTYTANTAQVQSQQTVRAGLDVLFGELRELSAQEGDVIAFGADSLKVRVMRRFGAVCNVGLLGATIDVIRVGEWFDVKDSVVVFLDTNPATTADDAFVTGWVTGRDTTLACSGNSAQRLTVPEVTTAWGLGQLVQPGAPVRSYTHYTYGLFDVDGEPYLARKEGATVVPLVGPVRANDGVEFVYYDSLGAVATTATDIDQVEVTLRTLTSVRGPDGNLIADSVSTRVHTRN